MVKQTSHTCHIDNTIEVTLTEITVDINLSVKNFEKFTATLAVLAVRVFLAI